MVHLMGGDGSAGARQMGGLSLSVCQSELAGPLRPLLDTWRASGELAVKEGDLFSLLG